MDFDRHRMSRMQVSEQDQSTIIYEVSIDGQLPDDNQQAEATRLSWAAQWLEVRGWCPGRFEVVERRRISARELNPYRHDLRYSIRCLTPDPS